SSRPAPSLRSPLASTRPSGELAASLFSSSGVIGCARRSPRTSSRRPGGSTLARLSDRKRSMISATAAIEAMMRNHTGQPAAWIRDSNSFSEGGPFEGPQLSGLFPRTSKFGRRTVLPARGAPAPVDKSVNKPRHNRRQPARALARATCRFEGQSIFDCESYTCALPRRAAAAPARIAASRAACGKVSSGKAHEYWIHGRKPSIDAGNPDGWPVEPHGCWTVAAQHPALMGVRRIVERHARGERALV